MPAKTEKIVTLHIATISPKGKNGGQYRKPADICVLEYPSSWQRPRRGGRALTLVEYDNCDSRYQGKNSRYGQCHAAAVADLHRILSGGLTSKIRRTQLKHSANFLFGLDVATPAAIVADRYEEAGMPGEAAELRQLGD